MLSLLVSALVAGGTYQVEGEDPTAFIRRNGDQIECLRLAPAVTLAVEGEGGAELKLWIDLPKKPKRPKAVRVEVSLDGAGKTHRLKPKRGRRLAYVEGSEKPSKPLKPIKVAVPAGRHRLVIELPAERTGCLAIAGLDRAPLAPPAPAEPDTVAATPPTSPPPPDAPAPGATPETETAAAAAAENPSVSAAGAEAAAISEPEAEPELESAPALELPASGLGSDDAEPALAMPPPPDGAANEAEPEIIHAHGVVEDGPSAEAEAETATARLAPDLLRIGPKVGGVMPRGDLQPTFFVGAEVELSLGALGVPLAFAVGEMSTDVTVFVSCGWNPMQQQDEAIIQGRGRTQLTQYSLVFPVDVGARFVLDLGFDLLVFAGAGLAIDFTSTELQAFSTDPVQEGDITFGFAGGAGVLWRLGPGALTAEIRYREIETDIGELSLSGEAVMANAALHLGYLFIIPN